MARPPRRPRTTAPPRRPQPRTSQGLPDRETVLAQVEAATSEAGLGGLARDVLFSLRRFKQRGARYAAPERPC